MVLSASWNISRLSPPPCALVLLATRSGVRERPEERTINIVEKSREKVRMARGRAMQ